MKVGEKVVIERLPSGLYQLKQDGWPDLTMGAASTAIAMAHAVFSEESQSAETTDSEVSVS